VGNSSDDEAAVRVLDKPGVSRSRSRVKPIPVQACEGSGSDSGSNSDSSAEGIARAICGSAFGDVGSRMQTAGVQSDEGNEGDESYIEQLGEAHGQPVGGLASRFSALD
jgi:hypothetical protein